MASAKDSALSTRTGTLTLDAYVEDADLTWIELLKCEASCAAWRIVELSSGWKGAAFEADVIWNPGTGQHARITVTRSTRVCVFTGNLLVKVANLCGSQNQVSVAVADGYGVTQNVCEERGTGVEGSGAQNVPIPPHAVRLRLEVDDRVQLASCLVKVWDGFRVRAELNGSEIPSDGMHLGAAGRVQVNAPQNLRFRVLYLLSL